MNVEVGIKKADEAVGICKRGDNDLAVIINQLAITPTDYAAKMTEVAGVYKQMAAELVEIADQITITNQADFESSIKFHQGLKGVTKKVESTRKEMKAPVLNAGRWVDGLWNPTTQLLNEAETITEGKAKQYRAEQNRIREEAERKAQEIADKERLRQERLARQAEERGNTELAEKHWDEAESIPDPVVLPTIAPVKGSSFRKIWKAKVTDPMALIKAVAAGAAPPEAVIPNETYLGQAARSLQGSVKWPGVEFYAEEILASSAK